MVIGGEDVFRAVLPQAGRIYLTEVHATPEADTWFPELDGANGARSLARRHAPGPKDDHRLQLRRAGACSLSRAVARSARTCAPARIAPDRRSGL